MLVRPAAPPFRSRWTARLAAAAFALLALAASGVARAGDAVRLVVELPEGLRSVVCPDQVDLQIVGEDAARQRVDFGRRTVEYSATVGTVSVVQAPYRYQYRTPATLDAATTVRIRAWLKEAPEIQGEATLEVLPPAPFRRLALQGPGSNPAGASMEFTLRGEGADGKLAEVPEGIVTLSVDGAGKVTPLGRGRYRFETAASATGTSKITATLTRYPKVTATLDVLNTGGTGEAAGGAAAGGGSKEAGGTKESAGSGGAEAGGGEKPSGGTKQGGAKKDEEEESDAVVWPSGNVRVEVWRVRASSDADWSKDRDRVKPGEDLVSAQPFQKLRIGTLRKDVKQIVCFEKEGEKGEPARLQPSKDLKDGRLVIVDRKDGTKAIHYEREISQEAGRVTMTLVLHLEDGTKVQEQFVLRRIAK